MYKKVVAIILLLLVWFPCNVFAKNKILKEEVYELTRNHYTPIMGIMQDFRKDLGDFTLKNRKQQFEKHSEDLIKKI